MSGISKRFIDADDVWDALDKNYIKNPGASQDTKHWDLYQDIAQAVPVDGSGGTSVLTVSRVAGMLRSSGSFMLEKPAQNTQGQGVGSFFEIDPADKNKELKISFDYYMTGTYNNDLRVFVYDVDNGQVLYVSSEQNGTIPNATTPSFFSGSFYTTGSSNYKLLFHTQNNTTAAFTLYYDGVLVSRNRNRVVPGDSIQVEYAVNTSGITAAGASDSTPANMIFGGEGSVASQGVAIGNINSMTVTGNSATRFQVAFSDDIVPGDQLTLEVKGEGNTSWVVVGSGAALAIMPQVGQGTARYGVGISTNNLASNRVSINFGNAGAVTTNTTYAAAGGAWSAVSTWRWRVKRTRVIKNTFSTTELMNKASGTLLASSASQTLGGSSQPKLANLAASKDVLSIWDPSTDKGKIRSSGFYDVSLVVLAESVAWTAGQQLQGFLYVNNSQVNPPLGRTRVQASGTYYLESQGTFTFYFNAGDELEFYVNNGNSNSITVSAWATIMARPDLTSFGVYGEFKILTATGSTKTPPNTTIFHALSNNYIDVPPGTWRLTPSGSFASSGGNPGYGGISIGVYSANGNDTSTAPASPQSATGVTKLSANHHTHLTSGRADYNEIPGPSIIVRTTASTTRFYAVTYSEQTTSSNARVWATLTAERLQ